MQAAKMSTTRRQSGRNVRNNTARQGRSSQFSEKAACWGAWVASRMEDSIGEEVTAQKKQTEQGNARRR